MRLISAQFLLLPLSLMALLSAFASPASAFTQCTGCRELETSQLELEGCISFRYPNKQLAVRDEATMKSLVRHDMSRERCLASLKDIDFSKHTLVGVELRTGWCNDPLFTYRMFKDEAKKKYLLSVVYEPPKVPCRALDQYDLWLLVPKLPEQYEFDFEAKAESPKSKSEDSGCDFSKYRPLVLSRRLVDAAVKKVEPKYPATGTRVRAQGKVKVKILVDREGNVVGACAVEGHPLLRAAAIHAAEQWKFKPNFGLTARQKKKYIQSFISLAFRLD